MLEEDWAKWSWKNWQGGSYKIKSLAAAGEKCKARCLLTYSSLNRKKLSAFSADLMRCLLRNIVVCTPSFENPMFCESGVCKREWWGRPLYPVDHVIYNCTAHCYRLSLVGHGAVAAVNIAPGSFAWQPQRTLRFISPWCRLGWAR